MPAPRQISHKVAVKPGLLQRAVRAEIQRQAGVGEEEMEATKIEQVVSADLTGEHLQDPRQETRDD